MWLLRLYDQNYLGHLISINEESRLVLYQVTRENKQITEEAFCVLGSARESYAVNVIDNLIVVHYLQVRTKQKLNLENLNLTPGTNIDNIRHQKRADRAWPVHFGIKSEYARI